MLSSAAITADTAAAVAADGDAAVLADGSIAARGYVEFHSDEVVNDDGSVRQVQRVIFYSATQIATGARVKLRGIDYDVSSAARSSGHIWQHHLRAVRAA